MCKDKIGIIVAMEEEMRDLLLALEGVRQEQVAGMNFYQGQIEGQAVCLVQSGIGKVNAGLAAAILIERYQVKLLVNTGSAGAIHPNLSIGDVVIASRLAYHDADARVFGYDLGQVPQMPLFYPTDAKMNQEMVEASHTAGLQPVEGTILSSDSFISDDKKLQEIKLYFPDALVTEMEGAAIAQVCYRYQLPCSVIRAVSDSSDNEAAVFFDDFVVEAGHRSAQMLLAYLSQKPKASV